MKKIILVSGLSGAGKSTAISILEDMGYHCIEQYPVQLLDLLVDLIVSTNDPRYNNVALSMPLDEYKLFSQAVKAEELQVKTLFLVANSDVLLSRYKSSRRTHPLLIKNIASTLEESITDEQESLNKIKDQSSIIIDTSHLSNNELKTKINKYFSINDEVAFSISFISFGYKHGVPLDADLLFDVRFLPNPYWVPELRMYSGDDQEVYDYVIKPEVTQDFLRRLTEFLDYLFEKYVSEGKNHLTVGIGCTGGQHRSVAITNYLYDMYLKKYKCYKDHRDKIDYHED